MESGNGFSYTYSAKEQAELKRIRAKYEKKEMSDVERVKALDEGVTRRATVAALAFGVVGALILGLGMSICMTELGAALGEGLAMPVGIVIGVIGGAILALAYPMYNLAIKRGREKVAPEIIRLTDNLIK
ncbi:MAG: hypothetical protein IJW03_02560 [Clostridia bacterium]|nr:hypothetical protein [Clostridia bacterium]